MNEGDAIDLVQSAIWMVVVGAGPCVGAAMAVGVVIALLQALTQIQEMTSDAAALLRPAVNSGAR